MKQSFCRIAAIKLCPAAINYRGCSNKYLGKEQLTIGKAAINNRECRNFFIGIAAIKYR